MTGIKRLRTLAGAWDEYGLGGTLGSVSDQIERERACDEDAIENVRLVAGGVIDDMERHVSGVEGAEDSPVARWASELRRALKSDTSDGRGAQNPSCADPDGAADVTSEASKVTRDPAEDVSMSAYDLLPADEREAIAWVSDHGGLSHVKDIYHDFRAVVERLGIEWSESELHGLMDALDRLLMTDDALRAAIEETCTRIGVEHTGDLTQDVQAIWREIGALRSRLKESVPRAAYERHLARRQRQIDESHAALRRRNERIAELERSLSEAVSAQLASDAALYDLRREVRDQCQSFGVDVSGCEIASEMLHDMNEALSFRLMPEGCEWPRFESGELVGFGDEASRLGEVFVICLYCDGSFSLNFRAYSKGERVKRPAPKVLDADGAEIYKGRIAYGTRGRKYRVTELCEYEPSIVHAQAIDDGELGDEFISANTGLNSYQLDASKLTHERPDSWERLEEDARMTLGDYKVKRNPKEWDGTSLGEDVRIDLVRRCRALAERERGE